MITVSIGKNAKVNFRERAIKIINQPSCPQFPHFLFPFVPPADDPLPKKYKRDEMFPKLGHLIFFF